MLWRRALVLGVLAAAVAVLGAVGALPRWPGLVHLVALPPLDVFADVRVLVARAPSYPLFVAGLLLSFVVRAGVLVALLPGALRDRLRFAAGFYAVALVLALLAAVLQFSGQAGLYARVFWPGVILMGLGLVLLGPVPWTPVRRLREAARAGFRPEALLVYAAALLGLGALAHVTQPAVTIAAVPISAALTLGALTWLSAEPAPHGLLRLSLFAVALAAVAFAFDGTRPETPLAAEETRDGSLVLMSGINSASGQGAIFEMHPAVYGFPCERTFHYSYAGPGDGAPQGDSACPIVTGEPYVEDDTQRPLDELVEEFRVQVTERDEPVVVIAHSQAPWIAWAALAEHGQMGVSELVLLGPFPQSPLGYPPPGEHGQGHIGGEGLRLVGAIGDALDFEFEPDAPLARQVLATHDASSAIFEQPLPDGMRVLAVPAVVDLPLKPDGPEIEGTEQACPVRAAHPSLPYAAEFHAATQAFLAGEPLPDCPPWRPLVGPLGVPLGLPPAGT